MLPGHHAFRENGPGINCFFRATTNGRNRRAAYGTNGQVKEARAGLGRPSCLGDRYLPFRASGPCCLQDLANGRILVVFVC